MYISAEEIRRKMAAGWEEFLRRHLRGEAFVPLEITRFRKPSGREVLNHFDAVRSWKQGLQQGSKEARGFGYRLEYETVNHRQAGLQRIPQRIVVESAEDYVRLIGRQRDLARFSELTASILAQQPALQSYLEQRPLRVLDLADQWPALLAVCHFTLSNPRCDRYLRELDIPGVDTKFIEAQRQALVELFDALLPASAIDPSVTGLARHGFERRYGFRYEQPRVRLRLLDPAVRVLGAVADLEIPLAEFAAAAPGVRRVYLSENKMTGLAFPPEPGALIIFGLGYGIEMLKGVDWLRDAEIFYWGDIDTHGLAILSQLRGYFPQVRSLLMDRSTMERCRPLWGEEDPQKRCLRELPHLTAEESELYDLLRHDRLAPNVRLEQERIGFCLLRAALSTATPTSA